MHINNHEKIMMKKPKCKNDMYIFTGDDSFQLLDIVYSPFSKHGSIFHSVL